jgi:OmpA-OmpF porin, OOP family
MMNKGFKAAFALLGLVAASTAIAQSGSDDGERKPFFEERPYYLSPAVSYILADGDRGTDDGFGATLSFGKKVTSGLTLELIGAFAQLGTDGDTGLTDNGDYQLYGVGLGAMVFPVRKLPNLYSRVNLMFGEADGAPGLVADYDTTIFDVGVGYLFPVARKLAIRAEALYRIDSHNEDEAGVQPNDNSDFYDGVFSLGAVYRFGESESDRMAVDTDGDGVSDPVDQCANTAKGVPVDETGCPLDSDGDGVPDHQDQCPDTKDGLEVDAQGCAIDSDSDGIRDSEDECPNSPAGAKVLDNGCALFGDCRKPRGGEEVDENGCALNPGFVLKGVKFEFDSEQLTEAAKRILDDVAEVLAAYPDVDVDVEGHTDQLGSDAYNLSLSERRARVVKAYLIGKDVEAARMTPVGFGRAQPLADNSTEEGREENRRVELRPTRR